MGRLENSSNHFRIFFLIQFTKEVLRNSASYDVETLQTLLKQKTKDIISKREKEKEKNRNELDDFLRGRKTYFKPATKPISKPVIKHEVRVVTKTIEKEKPLQKKQIISPVFKPKTMQSPMRRPVPERVQGVNIPISPYQNVMPRPTNEKIDLGELNPYLDDPSISTIECNGPDTRILVRRGREIRKTDFALTSDQIQEIIRAFSKASKIPVNEGVFRVAVGRVILTAQVSGEFGTKFILSKMY